MSQKYRAAGVDLEAGYESVERIKKHVASTRNPGVMNTIGAFGGLFDLAKYRYQDPVLVSGTDGVGTKLKLAIDAGIHDTIGIDLVAMCVNDILAQGATPLFFLDYLAVGKNTPEVVEAIVAGVCDGCIQAHAALIGGETAEMPDMYDADSYDLAGFAVGCAERSELIDIHSVQAGDVLLGFTSSGVHSNGYSLVRKIISDHNLSYGTPVGEQTLIEALLTPTKIYADDVSQAKKAITIRSMMHITGGGFYENIPRGIPDHLGVAIARGSWVRPDIFPFIQKQGNLSDHEMFEVFNNGIGFIIVASKEEAMAYAQNHDGVQVIGNVVNDPGVHFIDQL